MSWPIHKTSSTTLHKSLEKCFPNHLSDSSAPKFWDFYGPEFCKRIFYWMNIWRSSQIWNDCPGTNIPECSGLAAYLRFKTTSWTCREESSWETFQNKSLEHFSPEENELFFQWMPFYNYNMRRHLWRKSSFLFHSLIPQKWLTETC